VAGDSGKVWDGYIDAEGDKIFVMLLRKDGPSPEEYVRPGPWFGEFLGGILAIEKEWGIRTQMIKDMGWPDAEE
jgi:hypothetical protein